MTSENFQLMFQGYWREPNINSIPALSGIYCVYSCDNNIHDGTFTLDRLIYIGESGDVRNRIAKHEKWQIWRNYLNSRQQLCFNFAPVSLYFRDRLEAACIFRHKPPANSEYVDNFPFDRTTIKIAGKNSLLSEYFIVNPNMSNIFGYNIR